MKSKIFILMFCMILLVGTVSAIEWDNFGTYNEETKTMTIRNGLTLGTQIAKVELLTPQNYELSRGYKDIARFKVTPFSDYNNALKELELFDKTKENKKFLRDYDYKILSYENVTIKDYGQDLVTGEYGLFGTHEEVREVWTKLTPADFKKDEVLIIGIFTEVKQGDIVEWIPNIMGVRINEWAEWTESLNVDLNHYYKLNDTTDSILTDQQNLTNSGSVTFTPGLIGNNANTEVINTAKSLTNTDSWGIDGGTMAFSVWVNVTSAPTSTEDSIIGTQNDSSDVSYIIQYDNTGGGRLAFIRLRNGVAGDLITHSVILPINGPYQHIVASYDGAVSYLYLNGVLVSTGISSGNGSASITTRSKLFDSVQVPGNFFNGKIDEVGIWGRNITGAEVTQLFNSGVGITFTDFLIPSITLNSPIDFFNTSNPSITFNGTISLNTPDNVTYFLDDIGNETNTTGILGDYIFTKIIAEGIHTWNYQSCNSIGCNNGSARTFTIDQSAPIINITFPTEIIDFHEINNNLSINWTLTELLPDTCILEYEGVNRTVTCNDNQTEINITNIINKTIIFYANDTLGKTNSSSRTWDYSVFENSQTFNVNVFEGNLETFTANITVGDSNSLSVATLFYNGTSSIGSFSTSGDDYILSKTLQILEVSSETNITFIWNLQLSGGQSINITPHNQTINSLTLDDCSVNTVVLYNYTIVDEGNQSKLLNTTAELNINIKDTSGENFIANFSKLYSETNPFAVCLNIDFQSSIYSVDSIVRYESVDHVIEYYNILNSTLLNTTIPINITLFDLTSADSTEFKISFKGEDFVFVENALIFIDRQYISENNSFKTVELPKTDSEGQTVGHFVRSDAVYNIRVVKDSVLLATFNNIIAFCQDFTIGDCQIVLVATPSSQSTFNYDAELGILFDVAPTYSNDTNAVSFSYSTDDGTPKTVFLEVTRSDIFGNRTICNNTVISSSGTLSCSVDPNIDETNLITKVYVDGKLTILGNIVLDNTSKYGNLAYTLWFFLTFVFILGFGTSKTEVLIGLVVSIIGAISLGLVRGDIVGLGSAGVWMIVIVLLGIWKLNKENPQ